MNRRKRKKQSPAIVTCRRRLACLGLICTFLLPQTVLAAEPAQQDNYTDATVLIEITDSVQQIEPADAAAQNNTKDSAEASESLQEDRKEEVDKGAPADDDAASVESKGATDSVPEAGGSDADANAKANADTNDTASANTNADANDTAASKANADAMTPPVPVPILTPMPTTLPLPTTLSSPMPTTSPMMATLPMMTPLLMIQPQIKPHPWTKE